MKGAGDWEKGPGVGVGSGFPVIVSFGCLRAGAVRYCCAAASKLVMSSECMLGMSWGIPSVLARDAKAASTAAVRTDMVGSARRGKE